MIKIQKYFTGVEKLKVFQTARFMSDCGQVIGQLSYWNLV